MTTWPASLPRPVFGGYALDPLEPAIRTDMEAGSPRNRRRSKARNDRINVSWKLTDREMMIFRAWFDYDGGAAGGTAWFDILLAYGDLGLKTRECRFSGIYKATPQAGLIWTVTASLEVRGGELTADQMLGAVLGLVSADGIYPTLTLDFAADLALDSRIAFTRASVATYFDAAGVMRTAALSVPRFDHDPLTGESLGLLLEESRTNYIANTDTTASSAVVSIGTAIGPDGVTAYKVVPNLGAVALPSRGSAATQQMALATTEGQTTDISFSGYFAGTGPLAYRANIVVMADISGASQLYALLQFDPVAGTFHTKTLNTGWSELTAPVATLMPCGMWRVTWSVRYTQQATLRTAIKTQFQIHDQTGASSYTADGSSGVQYACMQLERGAYPTSYFPTTTAPAARSADSASMTGANFSSWYNQLNGTFLFNGRSGNGAVLYGVGTPAIAFAAAETIYSTVGSSGNISTAVLDGGVSQNNMASVPVAGLIKHAFAYEQHNLGAAVGGVMIGTDTVATVPTPNQLIIGGAFGLWSGGSAGSNAINKPIARLVYWPARLPNAELRSFSLA